MRLDAAIARLGVRLTAAQGVRSKMRDFMPWPKEDDTPATPEQIMALLTSKVKKKDPDNGRK